MRDKILIISSAFGAVCFELIDFFLNEKFQFIAIGLVVGLDAILGIIKAFKLGVFQTGKAVKFVYVLVALWSLLAVVLTIEKGFPFASFLSEAVLLPILTFELISILKNLQLLEVINSSTLSDILKRIDKHKEVEG